MKKRYQSIIFITISSLILISFQGMVSADLTNQSNIYRFSNIRHSIIDTMNLFSDDTYQQPAWYPGFLIVQLIKGIIAFFVILLILLDIIEPSI